jgi:hypothetical protein
MQSVNMPYLPKIECKSIQSATSTEESICQFLESIAINTEKFSFLYNLSQPGKNSRDHPIRFYINLRSDNVKETNKQSMWKRTPNTRPKTKRMGDVWMRAINRELQQQHLWYIDHLLYHPHWLHQLLKLGGQLMSNSNWCPKNKKRSRRTKRPKKRKEQKKNENRKTKRKEKEERKEREARWRT